MWFDWSVRLITTLALLTIVIGLVVLALPSDMEGEVMIRLDNLTTLSTADLIGTGLAVIGVVATWVTLIFWQRIRIEQ